MKNWKEILSNYPYLIWVLLYATIFWAVFGANAESLRMVSIIYGACLLIAITPLSEWLWRVFQRVRPLATSREKERLQPIFDEVYEEALKIDKNLFKNIRLFIKDSMDLNAFAYGKGTLILMRGSVEMLDDDDLKGIIAHEFGHFSNYDTVALLFAKVSNMLMLLFMKCINWITRLLLFVLSGQDPLVGTIVKIFYYPILWAYKTLILIGDLVLMRVSRKHEYYADQFAVKCGYGDSLLSALYQLNEIAMNEPRSFFKELFNTHPPLVKRIEMLEQ